MKKLLKPREISEILGCALSSVYQMHQTGRLKGIKIGKLLRFNPSEVEKLIKNSERKAKSKNA